MTAVTRLKIIRDEDKNTAQSRKSSGRRGPRKATPRHLERVALYYLERYASSAENLRRVLMHRVKRSASVHGTDCNEGAVVVDEIIRKFQEWSYLNDRAYAEMRVDGLHRRGLSVRAIRHRLMLKGVLEDDINIALEALAAETPHPDRHAAIAYARRRCMGPWRLNDRESHRERDLAALGRQGFSFDIARWVVDADSPEMCEVSLSEEN